MNLKRIICLILAAATVLTILASGIAILVSATDNTTTAPTEPTTTQGNGIELKNGDKIIIFILGAVVPCVIFLAMIVKTVWKKG